MSFTNQKPFTVTHEHLKLKWVGFDSGERFRCGLCGYKFQLRDIARWLYTNDMGKYCGNPFVCAACDGPDVKERWCKLVDEYRADRFWYCREVLGNIEVEKG